MRHEFTGGDSVIACWQNRSDFTGFTAGQKWAQTHKEGLLFARVGANRHFACFQNYSGLKVITLHIMSVSNTG